MWNQNYKNKFDEWEIQEYDRHSHHKEFRGNGDKESINYCPSCGVQLSTFRNRNNKSRNSQRKYQKKNQETYQDSYQSTFQGGSSCSSMFITLSVIIVLIIVIASCSGDNNSSANSDMLMAQDMNVESDKDITASNVSNVAYQYSEPVPPTKETIKEASQTFQSKVYRTYVVKPGDTLYRIATNMLGDGSRWIEIDQLNDLGRLSNEGWTR